jgi:hypothetical protein
MVTVQCKGHTRSGERCRRAAAPGFEVCYMHGAACVKSPDNGRPIEHALYSQSVPPEWRERYEYFKTDPNYLSLKPEIALAQTNMDRFLDKCEGMPFGREMREHLMAHVEQIGKLKEREAKRVYNQQVLAELVTQQVEQEIHLLEQVLGRHVDATTGESILAEFRSGIAAPGGAGAKVGLSINS